MIGSMETLSKLFSGEGRVKVMRLFLFNPEIQFSLKQIADKARVSNRSARTEIDLLTKSGMLKKRNGKITLWYLDPTFEYLSALQNLLINTRPLRKEEILKRLTRVGKLKMVIVSGVFIQNPDSRVDMLVVGDNLKRAAIDRIVKNMEAEIGKELVFASFETADFQYRLGMYDKLIRDILDYPHQKLLDKLGIKTA